MSDKIFPSEIKPVFYSALARTIPEMKSISRADGSVSGEMAISWLKARQREGKFKSAELEWAGVEEWLRMQTDRVSVESIALFVEENGVRVDEIVKGGAIAAGLSAKYEEAASAVNKAIRDRASPEEQDRLRDIRDDLRDRMNEVGRDAGETKYEQYVLPGGENYREILLTLPAKVKGAFVTLGDDGFINERFDTEAEARAAAVRNGIDWDTAEPLESKALYASNHWDEKNVIAHIRYNDRIDADGKRVLFVEEMQSDWSQNGLKMGFKESAAITRQRDIRIGNLMRQLDDHGLEYDDARYAGNEIEMLGLFDMMSPLSKELAALEIEKMRADEKEVSVGPFVTDTKAWLALSIKRLIRYAAENNYDKVAFVNGQQSADRYDLSKQIDRVRIRPMPFSQEKTTYVLIAAKDGDIVIDREIEDLSELEGIIGKDAAKIARQQIAEYGGANLSGIDLMVGGEGMKTFYDKIVPQAINDVLKRLGGGKVGTVTLPHIPGVRTGVMSDDEIVASSAGSQIGFEITPHLRAVALEGLPLFSKALEKERINAIDPSVHHKVLGESGGEIFDIAQRDSDRRAAITLGEADSLNVGNSTPMNAAEVSQRVDQVVEAILRDGRPSGVSSTNGASVLRNAMKEISLTGPQDLRQLANTIESLLPESGPMGITVDDKRRLNVHGAVEVAPYLHLSLFTAEGRTGLTYETVLHEALHVAVAARYRSLSAGMARGSNDVQGVSGSDASVALDEFRAVWEEFRAATAGETFSDRSVDLAVTEARNSPDEFFVRSLTDPVLQAYMSRKKYQGKTLWIRFKDWIKGDLFGLPKTSSAPSWLDAALVASRGVTHGMITEGGNFVRMADASIVQDQSYSARAQEDSPKFKKWFGRSKVKDDRGDPLVVYHGTDSDIERFIVKGGLAGHFGNISAANDRIEHNIEDGKMTCDGANVLPVYLSIENPVWMDDVHFDNAMDMVQNLVDRDVLTKREQARLKFEWDDFSPESMEAVVEVLKRKGYDGIVYENNIEGEGLSYIPFRPEQIKSAVGNNGDFNPDNPGIMNARARIHENSTEFKTWFGTSRMIDGDSEPQLLYHITRNEFTEFMPGGPDPLMSGPAIWLTPCKEQPAAHNTWKNGQFLDGTHVMPVYAKVERPLWIMYDDEMADARAMFDLNPGFPRYLTEEVVAAIKEKGYDGIFFADFQAAAGYDFETGRNVEVIVFESSQIKSAIGNNGDFDLNNPDIMASAISNFNPLGSQTLERNLPIESTAEVEAVQVHAPEFDTWFRDSKVVDAAGAPVVVYHGSSTERRDNYSENPDVISFDYEGPKFFSTAISQASSYMNGKGGVIVPAYLSVTNPYVVSMDDGGFAYLDGSEGNEIYSDVDYLRSQGYDGAVWREEGLPDVWVAFEAHQIRSVMDKNNEFALRGLGPISSEMDCVDRSGLEKAECNLLDCAKTAADFVDTVSRCTVPAANRGLSKMRP